MSKQLDYKKVKINYVDTAGQERFHAISSNYLKNANGILLVYAVNSRASFTLLEDWMKEVKNQVNQSFSILILGNKCDVEDREVTLKEGEKFANKINSKLYEVSAKTGYMVAEAFDEIARMTYEKGKEENLIQRDSIKFEDVDTDKKKKKCCK